MDESMVLFNLLKHTPGRSREKTIQVRLLKQVVSQFLSDNQLFMKKYLIMIMILVLASELQAQSYHFSQFYSTPILVNPASTGNYPGDIRISGNFRSQWAGDNNPYLTTALSAEYRLLREELPATSK